jgi:hypothetical protein
VCATEREEMHRFIRLLCTLLLAITLFPVAEIAQPVPVVAANTPAENCPPGYEAEYIAGESGADGSEGTAVFCMSGGAGPEVPGPPKSLSPWCASGYGTWNNPLTTDLQTGEVVIASGTTAVTTKGAIGSLALESLYNEARRRAWLAARGAGAVSSSFYWNTGVIELTAMILQIEPVQSGGGAGGGRQTQWRFHNMSGAGTAYRTQYWLKTLNSTLRDMRVIKKGTLRAVPTGYGENRLTTSPADTTRFTVLSGFPASGLAPTSSSSKAAIEARILDEVGSSFANKEGNTGYSYSPEELAKLYLSPREGWTANELPAGTLRDAYYTKATMRWAPGGGAPRLAFDLSYFDIDPATGSYVGPFPLGSAKDVAGLSATAVVSVDAYTPARQNLFGATTKELLFTQLQSVVKRNLTERKIGVMPVDNYGNVYKPENKYAFPIFHAPTPISAPKSVCTRDEFDLVSSGGAGSPPLRIVHPTPWVQGSYNGCQTIAVWNPSTFASAISNTGACWINWRIINIPEPRFLWSDKLYEFMPQVNVKQVAADGSRIGGAVYDPITITARRNSAGEVAYLKSGIPYPIPRSTTNKSLAVAVLPTYYNVTQVGVTAEVGVAGNGNTAGAGGFIVQGGRVARTTPTGIEYDLKLTFTQTPLERLQNSACRRLSGATLLRICGIGYDTVNKEWYYEVRIRTWYGGVYYAPGAAMLDPKLRGLFNPLHTVGIRGFLSATPQRIRNFSWPGNATGFIQQTGIRFPGSGAGITSPLFSPLSGASAEDLDYLQEMVYMSNGMSALNRDPSPDPSRPAYSYTPPGFPTGSFYPLFDVSGGAAGLCPVAVDKTACAVRVYVRSRQPILDR